MQNAEEKKKSQRAKEITVREAVLGDAKEIAEIERQCFATPWSEAEIIRAIKTNGLAHYFVAIKKLLAGDGGNEKVLGYVGVWYIAGEGHITNVAVSKEYRRIGIADMLIEALIKNSKEKGINALTLEVRKSNLPAQHLYKKHGFICEGVRKNYYDGKEDAIIMWKKG